MSSEVGLNRAELIKQAREDCNRGLADHTSRNAGTRQESVSGKRKSVAGSGQSNLKFMAIRIIAAVLLFLLFVGTMELGISYKNFNSDKIVEEMQSNTLFDKTEEYISTFLEQTGKAD